MMTLRSVPQAALILALLLTGGCAHHTTMRDNAPAGVVVVASDTAAAEMHDNTRASGVQTSAQPAVNPAVDAAKETAAAAAKNAAENATAASDPRDTVNRDFDAIYGSNEEYNPIADPTLPTPATQAISYDPWEPLNRRVHRFNNAIDRRIAKPLATAYVKIVPRPVRHGVGNFFNNLGQPVNAVNALLQGKPKQAGQSAGRFLLNSTVGIGGLFDPATKAKLPNKSEDFGQTLGVWGWRRSRYIELPLFGPRTIRDLLGMVGDSPLSPLQTIKNSQVRVFLQGLQLVDVRTQLLSVDSFREGAADDYSLVRDAWLQRRQYQIVGDRKSDADDNLPDYLQNNDDNPTVPIDAIPILPNRIR